MRISRLLLVLVLAAAVAGAVAPSASALTFLDEICVVETGGYVRICPQGETGKAYYLELKGREGCWPYVTFRVIGTLPPGLTLSSSGLISGTPTQQGAWEAWIEMRDVPASQGGVFWCGDDHATERLFRFTILQGVQIVQRQSTLAPAQSSTPYSLQFSATGGTPTWTVSSGSLPAGLTLSSSGLLSGTPTAVGDFSFQVTATAGSRTDTQTYSMSVVQKLQVGPAPAQGVAEVGVPFQLAPQASGGKPGYTWSVDGVLPSGLTMDAASGAISGTPTAAGKSTVKLTVTDTLGLTSTVNLPFTVAARLLVTKKPLPAATVGRAYKVTLRATGGVVPRTWRILGGNPGLLPKGLKLNARTGVLSGTPKQAGTFRLRIQVTDKLSAKSAVGFVVKVNA